jgi:CheY-like chemotaxis protein
MGEIWVVDDDADTREMLRSVLQLEGYRVAVAANGRQALERLRSGSAPALMLLDVMMPVMSGAELLTELRRDPKFAELPVVLISAFGELAASLAKLAQDYLPKPIDLERLTDVLHRHGADGLDGAAP